MPGVATEHVSAGRWSTQFTIKEPGDDARRVVQDVTAGHAYTATFGSAVYGPGTAALPRFFAARRPGYLMVSLDNFFEDAEAGLRHIQGGRCATYHPSLDHGNPI